MRTAANKQLCTVLCIHNLEYCRVPRLRVVYMKPWAEIYKQLWYWVLHSAHLYTAYSTMFYIQLWVFLQAVVNTFVYTQFWVLNFKYSSKYCSSHWNVEQQLLIILHTIRTPKVHRKLRVTANAQKGTMLMCVCVCVWERERLGPDTHTCTDVDRHTHTSTELPVHIILQCKLTQKIVPSTICCLEGGTHWTWHRSQYFDQADIAAEFSDDQL